MYREEYIPEVLWSEKVTGRIPSSMLNIPGQRDIPPQDQTEGTLRSDVDL